jgi:hypothetical protein
LDRNRGGAYTSIFIASAGLFGIFSFLTYYLQQTLGYSPLVTGVAFLPVSADLILSSNLSTIVLMPRTGSHRDAQQCCQAGLAEGPRRSWHSGWLRSASSSSALDAVASVAARRGDGVTL